MLTQKTADIASNAAGSVFSALFFSVPISTLTYLLLTCNKSAECQEGLNLTCSINTSQGLFRDLYKPELNACPRHWACGSSGCLLEKQPVGLTLKQPGCTTALRWVMVLPKALEKPADTTSQIHTHSWAPSRSLWKLCKDKKLHLTPTALGLIS